MMQFKQINPKLISSFIMLIVTGSLLVAVSFAWFAQNKEVVASGMSVTALDERITIGNEIRVVRKIGDKSVGEYIYRCDNYDNFYYLWEDGSFSKDEDGNMIPIVLSSLLPGEIIELHFTYSCTDSLIGRRLNIYFDDISSDTFFEHNDDGSEGAAHSVLCVYKCSFKKGTDEYSEGAWLVSSTPTLSDFAPKTFEITNLFWEKVSDTPEENLVEASVKISFDLDQYYRLQAATNQLSEKSFSIGALSIGVSAND
jgi:hypothetical protein